MRGLAAAAGLALALAAGSAAAFDDAVYGGAALVLTDANSSAIEIVLDPSLHAQVRVEESGSERCVTAIGGAVVAVNVNAGCDETLRIAIPADFPVTINQNGDGDISLDDVQDLTLSLGGDGDLRAGRIRNLVYSQHSSADFVAREVVGSARIDQRGKGDVVLNHLTGPLSVRQSGSGDVAVAHMVSPSATIEVDGDGDMRVGAGKIDRLQATSHGNGDISIGAVVGDATLRATDGGDVHVRQVTGTATKDGRGPDSVTIGGNGLDFAIDKVVARAAGAAAVTGIQARHSHEGGSAFHTLLTLILIGGLGYWIYRIVRRNGGVATLWNRSRFSPPPSTHAGAPTSGAVLALREALARNESRLAQVEGYVTSKEFELNRKFRDLK